MSWRGVDSRMQEVGQMIGDLMELRRLQEVGVPGPRKRDIHRFDDSTWTGRHHSDSISEKDRLFDRMGHEYGRWSTIRPDALELEIHASPKDLVESAEWLVEQEQIRIGHQSPCNRRALSHSSRQLPWESVVEFRQPHQRDEIVDAVAMILHRLPRHLEWKRDVVANRAPR